MDLEPAVFPLSSAHRFDSSSFSHVASIAASSFSSFASSYIGISLSNRTIHRFSTSPSNFRRFPPKKRKKYTPILAVFERFTERAIRAIIFSQKEAKSLGKDMVYTQHLLLGLISGGIVYFVLEIHRHAVLHQLYHSKAAKMLTPSFGEPGQCFPLKGSNGYVQVRLRTPIIPEAVTLEHVSKPFTPSSEIEENSRSFYFTTI